MSRSLKPSSLLLGLLCALSVLAVSAVAPATGAVRWAAPATAKIHPGVQMYTKGSQCTGNFVFRDRRGRVYVGYAAHCAGLDEATVTNGCRAKSLPVGTPVRFAKGGNLASRGTTVGYGRMVYSSWLTMQRLGIRRPVVCAHNDFALVRVGPGHVRKVNPSVPFWGGPVGLNQSGTSAAQDVFSYGSSSLRAGVSALAPKQGASLGTEAGGWSHPVYTLTPGVPGDSGSAFLDSQGRALGVLSTLAVAPVAGSNGVGDLNRELAFARTHSGIPGLRLVKGTQPFRPVL